MLSYIRSLRPPLLVATAAMLLLFTAGAATAQEDPAAAGPDTQAWPDTPVAYAEATFDAWINGDAAALDQLAEPSAVRLLLARDPGTDTWTGPPLCEGAAGSTYCTWASEGSQLLLRVSNEAASQGAPRAVTEAAFIATVDGVAIWPFSSQEAADNSQASVDEGHSPWMLDPATVANFFAGAILGWDQPIVERTADPARFRVVDSTTGVAVDVSLGQPARTGFGGIWAVTRLGSLTGE